MAIPYLCRKWNRERCASEDEYSGCRDASSMTPPVAPPPVGGDPDSEVEGVGLFAAAADPVVQIRREFVAAMRTLIRLAPRNNEEGCDRWCFHLQGLLKAQQSVYLGYGKVGQGQA